MILILALFGILLLFPLADVFIYPGFTQNYLAIDPIFLVSIATILSILIRFKVTGAAWQKIGVSFVFILAPLISILALIFRVAEILIYTNVVYQYLHIDPVQFGLLGLYVLLIGLPLVTTSFVIRHWRVGLLGLSIVLSQLLLLYWVDPKLFYEINREDNVVEYATFLAYVIATLFAVLCMKYVNNLSISSSNQKVVKLVIAAAALAMVMIAGEEISWGQRIFNWQTPEMIAVTNTQQEINLHNNSRVFGLVYRAYFVLNVYGLLSWLGYELIKPTLSPLGRIVGRLVTSRWYLIVFFIPNLIYVLLRSLYGNAFIDQWEEFTEVFLALGIMCIWLLNTAYLKPTERKSSPI